MSAASAIREPAEGGPHVRGRQARSRSRFDRGARHPCARCGAGACGAEGARAQGGGSRAASFRLAVRSAGSHVLQGTAPAKTPKLAREKIRGGAVGLRPPSRTLPSPRHQLHCVAVDTASRGPAIPECSPPNVGACRCRDRWRLLAWEDPFEGHQSPCRVGFG